MNFFRFLAGVAGPSGPFAEYGVQPAGTVSSAAGLVLLCLGTAALAGLALWFLKRPADPAQWARLLAVKALPAGTVLVFLLSLAGLYAGCALVYSIRFSGGGPDAAAIYIQALGLHLPGLAALILLVRLAGCSFREQFGLTLAKARRFAGPAVVFFLASLPLLWLGSLLYGIVLQRMGHDVQLQDIALLLAAPASPWMRSGLLLIVIVLAPVFEELVFRGVLLPFFVLRAGLFPGIALLSLLFAGLHLHIPALVPLFLLSAAFSLAYACTRSLLVPMIMHMLFNSATVLQLLLPD